MPLLQGQPFRLIKAPETIPPRAELYVIQHTGEKFLVKSDYEDRLALYSQSIWTCQCSGKSGLTHQEAWTSESKVRVMLSSSFPAPLWSPILHCIHHSTQPLDQLVETTSALCLSKFHPGEELTYLNPTTQVRVVSSRTAPDQPEINESSAEKPDSNLEKPKAGDSQSSSPIPTLTNGCTNNNQDGAPSLNGTSNGSAAMEEGSPSSSTKPKEDSPGRKKGMLSLLYDVAVIDEDRLIKDVPSKDLQRAYKIPPKEHFRLFIRANALRQRASAFTPWIVSEDLVKQYDIPGKLASVFTQPSFNFSGKKRKLDQPVETVKKQKSEQNKKIKTEEKKIKKEPKDTNAPKKKPGTKSGVKRSLKVELNKVESLPVKSETPVKMETSDSDDDISLAVLASKSPKLEANNTDIKKTPEKVDLPKPVKRETEKNSLPNKKMKQATLFDMKPSKTGSGTPGSPKKSPQKRVISSETVMRMPVMRRLLHQRKMYKGVRGMGRKIVYMMDQALNKLSLKHIAAISDQELQDELMKRREKVMEKRILATMSAEDREAYLKQKSLEEKKKKQETKFVQTLKIREENRKLEDKILSNLKPLPAPKLVPTPEEIPNSLFGDITMIIEFIECYRDIVLTDKKNSISSQHLIQALSAGKEGFKFISEIMVLLLHIIIDDERIGDNKELGVKLSELAVHYQTAMELARLCLTKGGSSDTASQHSDDHEYEEECELSEGLLKKLDTHELYELEAEEIIEVLRALCHRAMASYTCLEYFEDIDESALALHRQFLQIKKENNKQELLKKKEKREELLKKKMEKNKPSPKKTAGRPKKQTNTLENFIKKEDPAQEAEEEEASPDIISVVKRKRMTAEELQKEKEEQSKELREKQLKEEEEMKKQQIILAWEKVNLQKEALARLQPLGVDRNHDRYWLFNCTTPGLYVEKGWVDANTTYCVKSTSPRKEAVNGQLEMEKSPDVAAPSLSSPTSEKDPKTVVHTPTLVTPEKDAPEPIPMSDTPSNINGTGLGVSQSLPAVDSATEKTISVKHVSSNARAVSSSISSVSGPLIQPTQDKPSSTDNKTVSPACGSKLVHGTGSENGITSGLLSSKSEKTDSVQVLSSDSKNNAASFEPISDGPKAPQSNVSISNTPDTKKSEDFSKNDLSETVCGLSVSSVGAMSSQQMSSPRTLASVILPDCDSDSDEKPLAAVKKKLELEAEDRPLSDVKRQLELEAEDKPLSLIKKELSESPTKTPGRGRGRPPKPKSDTPPRPRGRPPKERLPGEEKIQRPRGRPPKPKTPDGTPVKYGEESPGTGRPRGRPKASRLINDDETFPPVGQNMWFYYNTLEEIDSLLESLAVKGLRESKLKAAIMQARKQMETNFVKEWQPLEELVDGSVQLLETLREDIIQIEKELNEGWLGSVPEPEAWEKKANEATTVQELGECLIEAQRHIQIKFLKGIMKPVRKPIPTENPEAQQEYEEVEGSAVQHWRDAVSSCSTLSRLHLLVGMFDSCIKWEKSMATKKCKVCRAQDTSVPLAICDKCEGSYHWRCLRPQITEEPPEPWYCPGCQPNKKERRKITINQDEEEREEQLTNEFKQEKICRVCERGIGLIFCSKCPAAYHSECHDPPLQTRARKDWKCVDCVKPRSRASRAAASAKKEASKIKEPSKKESRGNTRQVVSKESTSRRSSNRSKYTEVEEDEDEDEEAAAEESSENDDSHDEDFSTRRKSTRVRKTVNPPRRTTSRSVKKRSYKIESEEEEEDEDEEGLAEEEEEEQEGSEDEQVEEEEQGSDDDQEEEDEEEHNEDDDEKDDDDDDEEGKEVEEDEEDEDSEVERDEEEENDDEDEDDDDDDEKEEEEEDDTEED